MFKSFLSFLEKLTPSKKIDPDKDIQDFFNRPEFNEFLNSHFGDSVFSIYHVDGDPNKPIKEKYFIIVDDYGGSVCLTEYQAKHVSKQILLTMEKRPF